MKRTRRTKANLRDHHVLLFPTSFKLASSSSNESSKEVDPNGWNKADWSGETGGRGGGSRGGASEVSVSRYSSRLSTFAS